MSTSAPFSSPLFTDFPELVHLSRQDLEDLLNEPEYFQATFYSLPRVKQILQAQVELGRANEAIAKKTLASQDRVYTLRAETQQAFDEAKALEVRAKQLERKQQELHQRYSPSFLLLRLKHATTAQDELSEVTATAFVHTDSEEGEKVGTKEVDDFIKTFKEQRITYHKRTIWSEHWSNGKVTWPDD